MDRFFYPSQGLPDTNKTKKHVLGCRWMIVTNLPNIHVFELAESTNHVRFFFFTKSVQLLVSPELFFYHQQLKTFQWWKKCNTWHMFSSPLQLYIFSNKKVWFDLRNINLYCKIIIITFKWFFWILFLLKGINVWSIIDIYGLELHKENNSGLLCNTSIPNWPIDQRAFKGYQG